MAISERTSRWMAYIGLFGAAGVFFTAGLAKPMSIGLGLLMFAQYPALQFYKNYRDAAAPTPDAVEAN